MGSQYFQSLVQGSAYRRRHQIFAGHYFGNFTLEICFKAYIPVGDYTHQSWAADDGHAGYAVPSHQGISLPYRGLWLQGKGIGDDAVFRALDSVNLLCLLFNGHVLVNNANAAFPGQRNGHTGLGDSIHAGAEQGDVDINIPGKLGFETDLAGQHRRLCRNQENVIKGQGDS